MQDDLRHSLALANPAAEPYSALNCVAASPFTSAGASRSASLRPAPHPDTSERAGGREGRSTMITLLRRYWNDLVSYDGGFALLMMDGLLAVPLIMAAFFYPLQVLAFVVVLAVVSLAGYEGYVIWRKRHPTHI